MSDCDARGDPVQSGDSWLQVGMNADGPGRPEPTAPRPTKRGRNRTFASWNDCCKPGGPLD
eukprot:1274320-Prymnesium_polylepis.1